jgi:hypothetical protein
MRSVFLAVLTLGIVASDVRAQQRPVELHDVIKMPVDASRSIANGETKRAAFAATDGMLSDSTYFARWYFSGTKGQRVRINQASEAFDTYLHLARHGATEIDAQNDDAEGTDSEVTFTLPADGMYVIIANSYTKLGTGDYTLALEIREAAPGLSGPQTTTSVLLREVEPLQRISVGMRMGSQISPGDPMLDDSTQVELWYVNATAGDALIITLETTEFPGLLRVGKHSTQTLLGTARVMAGRAELVVNIPETGTYVIVVQSAQPGVRGNYVVETTRAVPIRP